MKLLSLAALIGAFGCFTLPAPATAQQSCGQRDQVLERLGTQYGESRQSIGLAPNNGVVELFASTETGTWTLLMTQPNGVSCLIASGQAFEMTSVGGSRIASVFWQFLRLFSSVPSSVRPVYVLALPPLALMSSASEVPIGLSTSKGRCHSRSVLALG